MNNQHNTKQLFTDVIQSSREEHLLRHEQCRIWITIVEQRAKYSEIKRFFEIFEMTTMYDEIPPESDDLIKYFTFKEAVINDNDIDIDGEYPRLIVYQFIILMMPQFWNWR